MTSKNADVIVIGGGLHGCSAALHLARQGMSAIVLEKDTVGRHASGLHAGGLRRLGRAYPEIPLSVAATAYWRDIAALVDDDCGYRESRYLKIAFAENELEKARQRVAELHKLGFDHEEVVDAPTLRRLLPAATDDCLGALHVAGDGYADTVRTMTAFRRRTAALGATICEGSAVATAQRVSGVWHLSTASGEHLEAPVVVNAAGAWGGGIAAMFGEPIPVEARAPMLVLTEAIAPFVDAVVGVLGDALSLKQFEDGTVLIGGGVVGRAVPETNTVELDDAGVRSFVGTAKRLFPVLETVRIVKKWGGIEGYTPDNLPVIGPGAVEGVVHAFGFSAHGFQLAPVVGEIIADCAQGREPRLSVEHFRSARFHPTESP